jgi:hypothetical protein
MSTFTNWGERWDVRRLATPGYYAPVRFFRLRLISVEESSNLDTGTISSILGSGRF